MSLGEQVVQELMQMGGAELPLIIRASIDSRSASGLFSQWSPLAVGAEVIKVTGVPANIALNDLASNIASKLNYLSEPIRAFEIDTQAGEAQLRSDPPKPIGDGVEYFEVRIANDGTRFLHRYRTDKSRLRWSTPYALTLETLSRVIDDLATG